MKIILLSKTLSGGGAQRLASEFSLNLPKEISCTLVLPRNRITYSYRGDLKVLNIREPKSKYSFLSRIKNFVKRFKELKRMIKEVNPDFIIAFSPSWSFLSPLIFKNTIIMYQIPPSIHSKKDLIQKLKIVLSSKKAKKIVAVSKGVKEDLIRNFGIENKIKVVYNPVDFKKILPLTLEKSFDSAFKKWSDKNFPIIINIGRLSKQKGQWHLIRAFSEVRKYIDCKLVILGEGELKNYLKKLVEDLKVKNDVLFLGFQKNPFKYLKNSDIFVLSSLYEGFGIVLAEAMTCGLPVISTDCKSGPREIFAPDTSIDYQTKSIEYAKYGILVPVCDGKFYKAEDRLTNEEKLLANSILKLLENKDLREKYPKFSLERAKDFDVTNWMNQWLEILNYDNQ